MEQRALGRSGIMVTAVSFGAGPVSGLMVGADRDRQRRVVNRALDAGINWFDTAAGYGDGRSESALGAALGVRRGSHGRPHLGTKVRLAPEQLSDVGRAVRSSVRASLERLGVDRVTLLQLHNSVTSRRGDLPTSVSVRDVLGKSGVVAAFEALRDEGRVEAFGFTGLGDRESLNELVDSGVFTSAQIPLNLLTPFSGGDRSAGSVEGVDYERLAERCAGRGVGVIAIRVLAGGALMGRPAGLHTRRTKFFPLDLYQRDVSRAARLRRALPEEICLPELSVRRVLEIPGVTTALLGFASPDEVDQAARFAAKGPLEHDLSETIRRVGERFARRLENDTEGRTR